MPPKSRSYQVSATPVTMFSHLVVISVTTLSLVWLLHFQDGFAFKSENKSKILNVHIFSMVVGFILVTGEAIMAYKTVPAKRKLQKTFHLLLHLVAFSAGVLGVSAAFKYKHESGKADMITLHSWLGIATISLFGFQWILGFFSYAFPGAEMSARAAYVPWHVFGGMFIFCLAICTAETGLLQRFNTLVLGHSQEGLILNSIGLLLVLFAVTVGLTAVLPRGRY